MKVKKTRLEIITEIKELELRKTTFEAILNDVSDYYCKDVSFTVQMLTGAFNDRRHYDGDSVDVNKELFKEYLEYEIKYNEQKIKDLIEEMIK